MKSIIVYTDGSCNAKTRFGGFGFYIQYKNDHICISFEKGSFGYSNTTTSRMELRAIIKALQTVNLDFARHILLISDSQYTINSINNGWVFRWERDLFDGRKNADLWKEFLKEYRRVSQNNTIMFIHTRGHGKGKECYQKGNDIADQLADYKQFKTYIHDEETEN